jgi:lariat debranching enzyme
LDLDMDEDEALHAPVNGSKESAKPSANVTQSEVSQDIRNLLPESFSRPKAETVAILPFPENITNTTTNFLALDKCLPKRSFLQLLQIDPHTPAELQRPSQLQYDQEWLAITRVFADQLKVGDPHAQVTADKGDAFYRPLIEKEISWVEENLVQANKMTIPEDFAQTAPVYEPSLGIHVPDTPQEYSNPHTQTFCDLLQIPNAFHASDEERAQLMQNGPRPEQQRSNRGGARGGGGHRGGGRGQGHRGRGRGGRGGRGRGRG